MTQHRVLLACMPKSGSTYVCKIFAQLPGFVEAVLVPGYGRREQELCHERLLAYAATPESFIAQHHVRYSHVTRSYIEEFSLEPVVLVRNVFDVVPSLIDHHRLDSTVYPAAFAPEECAGWDFERAAAFVTYMAIPWYFNFFVSWTACQEKILVTYEDVILDAIGVMRRICDFWRIDVPRRDIAEAVLRADALPTRKNLAVRGRGDALPQTCKRHIRNMAAFYSGTDFSSIGL